MGLLTMGGRAGQAARAEGPEDNAMNVTLVAAQDVEPAAPTEDRGTLQPLFARFDTGAPPVVRSDTAGSGLAAMLKRMTDAPPSPQEHALQRARAQEAALERQAAAQERPGDGAAARSGGGGLWGVVAPCWANLGRDTTATVTLDVAVDGQGRVSTPPRILRPPGTAVDERQLQAESRALAALSTCMAQAEPRFAGQQFHLAFRPLRR
jgi:hypothetical protein